MSFDLDIAEKPIDIQSGEWVDNIPGHHAMRLKVRSLAFKKFEAAHGRVLRSMGRNAAKAMESKEYKVQAGKLIADHLLIGWEKAVTQGGADVPYSKDAAEKILTITDERGIGDAFRDAVIWAAGFVRDRHLGVIEDLEGN